MYMPTKQCPKDNMDLIRCGICLAIFGLNFFIHAKRLVRKKSDKHYGIACSFKNNSKDLQPNKTMNCKKCSPCPAGYRLKKKCNAESDTVCKKCPAGYFSPMGSKRCKKCTKCRQEHHQIHPCTDRHNTRCKYCRTGRYFFKGRNKCLKCRKCPPGYFVKKACTSTTGTICQQCPFGTYLDRYSMETHCVTCRSCRYNEVLLTSCTRNHDNICGNCRKGYFRLISTGGCAKCSKCYKDFPGYTIEIAECASQTNDKTRICMPVSNPPFGYSENLTEQAERTREVGKQNSVSSMETKTSSIESTIISTSVIIVFIVLFVTITALIFSRRHNKNVDKLILETSNTKNKHYISDRSTATWVNQLPTEPIRSNSVPFLTHTNDFFIASRERSNTLTNDISSKYLDYNSSENLDFDLKNEKMYQSCHSSEFSMTIGLHI